jgi:hypothetical protein
MILTHFLAVIALPPVVLVPAPGLLPMADSGTGLNVGRSDPVLLPRLMVRAGPVLLPVRGS